jgi:hypothetical protein
MKFSLQIDWHRVRRSLEFALEAAAVLWVVTSYSFEPVVPVYQWY